MRRPSLFIRMGRFSGPNAAANLHKAGLALILVVGAALRLYGLTWDGGHWLHPDERQIYFVVLDLGCPHSLAEALSPDSPLNPHFFAYGSLPIYLLKLVAALLSLLWPAVRDPDNLHLAGRLLSALADLGTVYLAYRLARRLDIGHWVLRRAGPPADPEIPSKAGIDPPSSDPGSSAALLAATFVSLAVLHVQHAHFYTADTLLALAVMLTLNLAADVALGAGRSRQIALGVALGLALATKVSAAPLALTILVAYWTQGTRPDAQRAIPRAGLSAIVQRTACTLLLAGIVFLVVQPYALIDWATFLDHTLREAQIARGSLDVPYTLQYTGTLPFLYSLWQTALWGLGLPLGLVAWAALALVLVRWLRHGRWPDALLLAWAGPYLFVVGLLHTRYLRYMLPLVPVLCIIVGRLLAHRARRSSSRTGNWVRGVGCWVSVAGALAYAFLFVRIYADPHPWIAASEWIYLEVPSGSAVAVEHWDTPLPLPLELEGVPRRSEEYDSRTLNLYDEPDGAAKWEALVGTLAETDYVIVASRRLYGSIPRVPDRYPLASRYHKALFGGELGFEVVGEFSRGPGWLNPRLPPLPGAAPALLRPDESFVVYDHPRALILRNAEGVPADELLRRLDSR